MTAVGFGVHAWHGQRGVPRGRSIRLASMAPTQSIVWTAWAL